MHQILLNGKQTSSILTSRSPQIHKDSFDLWQRLGLPSYVVLNLPDYKLHTLAEEISTWTTDSP